MTVFAFYGHDVVIVNRGQDGFDTDFVVFGFWGRTFVDTQYF